MPAPADGPGGMDVDAAPEWELLYGLYGHSRTVTCVEFSPDGQKLATCGADCLVHVWETCTGRLLQTWSAHDEGVNAVCWTRDSRYIAKASDDRTVRVFDVESVRCVANGRAKRSARSWATRRT